MLTGVQVKMARAALGWGVRELAAEAGLNPNTVMRFEHGGGVQASTVEKLERALEAAGVVFIDSDNGGPGVRLKSGQVG